MSNILNLFNRTCCLIYQLNFDNTQSIKRKHKQITRFSKRAKDMKHKVTHTLYTNIYI